VQLHRDRFGQDSSNLRIAGDCSAAIILEIPSCQGIIDSREITCSSVVSFSMQRGGRQQLEPSTPCHVEYWPAWPLLLPRGRSLGLNQAFNKQPKYRQHVWSAQRCRAALVAPVGTVSPTNHPKNNHTLSSKSPRAFATPESVLLMLCWPESP